MKNARFSKYSLFILASLVLLFVVGLQTSQGQTIRNVATDATDPNNLSDTEPSIAVNPRNPQEIAIVSFSEAWGPDTGAPVWRSLDGGVTWQKIRVVPRPPSRRSGPGDQFLTYDSEGRLYLTELDLPAGVGQKPFNYIYRQNGNVTSDFLPGKTYGDDQPLVNVDRTIGGPCFQRVYSPWLNSDPLERSMVVHSADSGVSVTPIGAGDNSTFPNRTTRLAIASDGKTYIVYKSRRGAVDSDFERARFEVVRSDDCGQTWSALGPSGISIHAADTVQTWYTKKFGNPTKGKVNRARSSDAWIATDPSDGDVYVAYISKDSSNKAQIYVSRSRDHGATWVSKRVTDSANNSAFPEIAVADNGAVGVLFIDYDDSGPTTIFRHRFAQSNDDGGNWTNRTLQSMDPNLIDNATDGFIWGDYEGLTSHGNTFYGVFTGQSLPGQRSKVQLDPIFFSVSAEPVQAIIH